MEALGLTFEMIVVLGVLVVTIALFVSEIVRVDVAAFSIMVAGGGFKKGFVYGKTDDFGMTVVENAVSR